MVTKVNLWRLLWVTTLATCSQQAHQQRVVPDFGSCPEEDRVTYTAAVLEFEPVTQVGPEGGLGLQMENTLLIAQYASVAKDNGADIFVSPEYSVQSLEMSKDDPIRVMNFTQMVPDPVDRVVPCTDTPSMYYEAVQYLSCTAMDLQMYLVIDLGEQSDCSSDIDCPSVGYFFYNTQVVFDRSGAVIARYRKQNLYLEPHFEAGPQDDSLAVFDTDFGVRFSLQICFDIVYQHPGYSNVVNGVVRDVVMSTAWVDEVPFLLAINVQNGWSRSLNTNLMVSGYHWPERTKLGSGIYRGYSDATMMYSYDAQGGDSLVVGPVDSCRTTSGIRSTAKPARHSSQTVINLSDAPKAPRNHSILHEDLSAYNRTVLPPTSGTTMADVTLCHSNDDFCCTLQYQHSTSNLTYQFMVFSGMLIKGAGTYRIYAQVCGVVWCNDDTWESCALVDQAPLPGSDHFGPFTLEADFSADEIFVTSTDRTLQFYDNNMVEVFEDVDVGRNVRRAQFRDGLPSMMSASLFSRWYSKDPPGH